MAPQPKGMGPLDCIGRALAIDDGLGEAHSTRVLRENPIHLTAVDFLILPWTVGP